MDDFLLVAGMNWIEVENPLEKFPDPYTIQDLAYNQDWFPLSQHFEDAGLIEPNTLIAEARVINTGNTPADIRIWYRL